MAIKMRWSCKISIMFFLTCLMACSGCRLLESAVSDVNGWNLSACVDGFNVCWELYLDNSEKFEDGFVEAMDTIAVPEE